MLQTVIYLSLWSPAVLVYYVHREQPKPQQISIDPATKYMDIFASPLPKCGGIDSSTTRFSSSFWPHFVEGRGSERAIHPPTNANLQPLLLRHPSRLIGVEEICWTVILASLPRQYTARHHTALMLLLPDQGGAGRREGT